MLGTVSLKLNGDYSIKANKVVSKPSFSANKVDYWNSYDTFTKTIDKDYFQYEYRTRDRKIAKNYEEIPFRHEPYSKDARWTDISNVKMTDEQLLNLCIDKTTVMSPEQKAIIDKYTEITKDPGLGIRDLHKMGYTGKGVKMAIIDQAMCDHKEYSANIVGKINDVNCRSYGLTTSEMHGPAVASIAVGKDIGVAPDANLVYYSAINSSTDKKDIEYYKKNLEKKLKTGEICKSYYDEQCKIMAEYGAVTNKPYAEALNKILDDNKKLPKKERVQVVSVSWGFNEDAIGYDDVKKAIERAKKEGVFVISTALEQTHNMDFIGANRNPLGDMNNPDNYEMGSWQKTNAEKWTKNKKDNCLLVPMEHRTVANPTGKSDYRYEGYDGGMSWATPWFAGMYVLAKQADMNITPEKFWEIAIKTSDECRNNDTGVYVGRLINPKKIIAEVEKSKNNA